MLWIEDIQELEYNYQVRRSGRIAHDSLARRAVIASIHRLLKEARRMHTQDMRVGL